MLLHGFPQGVATHTPPATPVVSAGLCPCSTSLSRFPNVAKLLGQGIASPWGQPPLCGFFLTALGHCLFLVYTRSIGCTVFSCPLASDRNVLAVVCTASILSRHTGPHDYGGRHHGDPSAFSTSSLSPSSLGHLGDTVAISSIGQKRGRPPASARCWNGSRQLPESAVSNSIQHL